LIAIISVAEIPVPLAFDKRGQLRGGLIKMGAEGFEPSKAEPSDLQSDPFVHFGTRPMYFVRGLKHRKIRCFPPFFQPTSAILQHRFSIRQRSPAELSPSPKPWLR
jgi:hypothetical protein